MNEISSQLKLLGIKTMLYCPKCRRTYQEGTQRFCTNDGGRLLPAPSNVKSANEVSQGVFSNLVTKSAAKYESDEKLSIEPRFPRNEPPVFASPRVQKILGKKESDELLEIGSITNGDSIPPLVVKNEKPIARLVKPHEIPSSQAELGDRKKNPTGRLAMTWSNPNVLLGQTVKGRYYVEEKLSHDDSSISFLANDKILLGKKVVVKILMDENDKGTFLSKQAAEERIALSHLNHPNIASLFDSGELLEGKPFLITEYVEGKSLRSFLQQTGSINPQRAARIVRQIALSLNDAHQSGVLHRGLRPEKVLLGVSDIGSENVKVTDYAGFSNPNIRNQTLDKVSYWSPEQVEGNSPTCASDTYTLGVIAYEMLVGNLPFSFSSAKELLDSQKRKLSILPSKANSNLSSEVDEIIQKALSYTPSDRYSQARDFGESLFNALNSLNSISETLTETTQINANKLIENELSPKLNLHDEDGNSSFKSDILTTTALPEKKVESSFIKIEAKPENANLNDTNFLHISPKPELFESEELISTEKNVENAGFTNSDNDLWKKRSPEPPKVVNMKWIFGIGFIATVLLIAAVVGLWNYFVNKQTLNATPIETVQQEILTNQPTEQPQITEVQPDDVDVPPAQRVITPPTGYVLHQNTKENMKDAMLKNFRGFSMYYPQTWTKIEKQGTNYVDVRHNAPNGIAIEEMVVGWYASKGTYKEDVNDFPKLADIASKELDTELTGYKRIDDGKKFINKDRKVYEMRFEGMRKTPSGEPYTVWGRILWIPAQRRGIKSGLRVTLIATSYSDIVKSIDDVGVNGELKQVLSTFEPDSIDSVN